MSGRFEAGIGPASLTHAHGPLASQRRGVSQSIAIPAPPGHRPAAAIPLHTHTSPQRSIFSFLLNSFKCNLVETFAEINLHVLRLMKQKIKHFIFLFVCYSIVLYLISKCIFNFTIISSFYNRHFRHVLHNYKQMHCENFFPAKLFLKSIKSNVHDKPGYSVIRKY